MPDPTADPSCSACSEPIPDPAGRRARQSIPTAPPSMTQPIPTAAMTTEYGYIR